MPTLIACRYDTATASPPYSPLSIGTMTDGCALPPKPKEIVGAAPCPKAPAVFVVIDETPGGRNSLRKSQRFTDHMQLANNAEQMISQSTFMIELKENRIYTRHCQRQSNMDQERTSWHSACSRGSLSISCLLDLEVDLCFTFFFKLSILLLTQCLRRVLL